MLAYPNIICAKLSESLLILRVSLVFAYILEVFLLFFFKKQDSMKVFITYCRGRKLRVEVIAG